MTNVSTEDLEIRFVSQEFDNFMNKIELRFSLNAFPYSLWIESVEGLFQPTAVFHDSEIHPCPYCGKVGSLTVCENLLSHQQVLFQTLIQVPSIRLEWLYLPHKET